MDNAWNACATMFQVVMMMALDVRLVWEIISGVSETLTTGSWMVESAAGGPLGLLELGFFSLVANGIRVWQQLELLRR